MDENSDLCVKIDNPQKHLETLETYITFRITTKVARIEFSDNEYIVRRRYNDFLWLRQKLIECHPFCIVPVSRSNFYSVKFVKSNISAITWETHFNGSTRPVLQRFHTVENESFEYFCNQSVPASNFKLQ